MSAETNNIRRKLKGLVAREDFWVRQHRDGSLWAGPNVHNMTRCLALKTALESVGYSCALNGQSGTAGEFIIDIAKGN